MRLGATMRHMHSLCMIVRSASPWQPGKQLSRDTCKQGAGWLLAGVGWNVVGLAALAVVHEDHIGPQLRLGKSTHYLHELRK